MGALIVEQIYECRGNRTGRKLSATNACNRTADNCSRNYLSRPGSYRLQSWSSQTRRKRPKESVAESAPSSRRYSALSDTMCQRLFQNRHRPFAKKFRVSEGTNLMSHTRRQRGLLICTQN